MTKSKHGSVLNEVERALHDLLNHKAPVRPEKPARTSAEEQAFVHGYAQGWEARQEVDTTSRRDS